MLHECNEHRYIQSFTYLPYRKCAALLLRLSLSHAVLLNPRDLAHGSEFLGFTEIRLPTSDLQVLTPTGQGHAYNKSPVASIL